MKKLFHFILTLGLGLYATDSSAKIFELDFTPVPGMLPAVQAAIETELQKVEDDINADLPAAESPDRLMQGMANSSVMAGKGIGSDYASGMKVMLIGGGLGVGADLKKDKASDSDLSGVGVQGGIVLGTNLSWMDSQKILGLDTNKLNVYVNFFNYSTDKDTGDTNAKIKMASYGVHFSYDWIKGSGSKLWGWGGVKLHTGYEYNKTDLAFTSDIRKDFSATAGGGTYTSNINANPFASINVNSHSIPVEISTSLRFLYLFSLYGGLGADYNSGSATGKGDLNSTQSNVTCAGVCSPAPGTVGTIDTSANIDGKGNASPFLFRGFAGLQINLPYIRIFGQVDKAVGNELIGATAGVRFVY